jgi:cytochrome c
MTAAEYLRQSIVDPDAYVVEGYRAGQMLPVYAERLSPEQIEALVDYLLTLQEGS